MTQPRSKAIKHRLEYIGLLFMDGLLSVWPASWAFRIGERLGLLFSLILGKRRQLILSNLKAAFPEKPDADHHKIANAVWRNLGRNAAEFIHLPQITTDNYRDFFVYENEHYYDQVMAQGRGAILVGPHFTNWEMCGIGHQFARKEMVAIARPMKNPWSEKWVQRKRKACQMDIILHRQAVKGCLKVLKQKKAVAILMDQNLYTGGVFVNFFGRPAATTTLPALLHDRTQAPVMVVYCLRDGHRFRLVYNPPLQFPAVRDVNDRLQQHTQIMSDAIEEVIRKKPENWFWIHNRWKRAHEVAHVS